MTSQNPFLCNYFQVTVEKLVSNLIVSIWEHWRGTLGTLAGFGNIGTLGILGTLETLEHW